MRSISYPCSDVEAYRMKLNFAFGAKDFHLSVFKQEGGLEKEIFWVAGTVWFETQKNANISSLGEW